MNPSEQKVSYVTDPETGVTSMTLRPDGNDLDTLDPIQAAVAAYHRVAPKKRGRGKRNAEQSKLFRRLEATDFSHALAKVRASTQARQAQSTRPTKPVTRKYRNRFVAQMKVNSVPCALDCNGMVWADGNKLAGVVGMSFIPRKFLGQGVARNWIDVVSYRRWLETRRGQWTEKQAPKLKKATQTILAATVLLYRKLFPELKPACVTTESVRCRTLARRMGIGNAHLLAGTVKMVIAWRGDADDLWYEDRSVTQAIDEQDTLMGFKSNGALTMYGQLQLHSFLNLCPFKEMERFPLMLKAAYAARVKTLEASPEDRIWLAHEHRAIAQSRRYYERLAHEGLITPEQAREAVGPAARRLLLSRLADAE